MATITAAITIAGCGSSILTHSLSSRHGLRTDRTSLQRVPLSGFGGSRLERDSQPCRKSIAPVAAFPFFLGYNGHLEIPAPIPTFTEYGGDMMLPEGALKAFYMIFVCIFCWGAVVFGSMNDAFYDSDEYRNAGGNGTQFWIYSTEEEAEEESRQGLWRDELLKEIEDRGVSVKELTAGEEEEEKEKAKTWV
eukprot:jgi/Mesen1/1425/ME001303S00473